MCEAIKSGVISKPIVAWCIGTCADMFTTDVQFGHAGASAGAAAETATSKGPYAYDTHDKIFGISPVKY